MHVASKSVLRISSFAVSISLSLLLAAARPAGAQLSNPGFDAGPPGPVFNFGTVVGPPAAYGFWGAEDASIDPLTLCGTSPLSPQYMLTLNPGGGAYSQAWQAVDVSAGPPSQVSLRAWHNTCSHEAGVIVGVEIRMYNNPNGWPIHSVLANNILALDNNVLSWQQSAVNCIAVPPDTKWILAQVFMQNASSPSLPSYVDDVELIFDECPTPVTPSTWSGIKTLLK